MGKSAEILNFPLDDGSTLGVTLKPHAVNVFQQPGENLWTYDLEGRLIGMYVDGINYRRTLNNQFFKKTRLRMHGEEFRQVIAISPEKIVPLMDRAADLLLQVGSQLPGPFNETVGRILTTEMSVLNKDAAHFNEVYLPISILPPDQYLALVLQITQGCNFNRCTFCNFYRDRAFRIKSQSEVEAHLNDVRAYFGEGLKLRRSIFLADANALVIPQQRLVPILKSIRSEFPSIPKIYSFIDVFTGIRKTAADFSELAELGIRRVYLGLESGNPELLALLGKPQYTEDILKLGKNLKKGGIRLGIILLAGAGGEKYRKAHLRDSLDLIEKLDLGFGDIVYISEFYETNPEYRAILAQEGIEAPGALAIRKMSNELKFEMRRKLGKDTAVSVYDIQQFFY